ncbi:alkaline phosphatase [Bradyrhizobium liaoningense]
MTFIAAKPDVLMGGGSANFLPKSAAGSKRKDETDYIAKFRDAGYQVATTASELGALSAQPEIRNDCSGSSESSRPRWKISSNRRSFVST